MMIIVMKGDHGDEDYDKYSDDYDGDVDSMMTIVMVMMLRDDNYSDGIYDEDDNYSDDAGDV